MTTKQLERRVIERTERLNSSANGNPRFRFYFTDGSVADLSSDASFGYEAENPEYRAGRTVDVSFTRAGRVEYMRPVAVDVEAGDMSTSDGLGGDLDRAEGEGRR